MNTKNWTTPYRREWIELMLDCGCVPDTYKRFVDQSKRDSYTRGIRKLCKEGFVEETKFYEARKVKRAYTICNDQTKVNEYIFNFPFEAQIGYKENGYEICRDVNRLKDADRRTRAYRAGETGMMMYVAGVPCSAKDKWGVMKEEKKIERGKLYLTSQELKSLALPINTTNASRAMGVLISPDKLYTIYNTGHRRIKYRRKTENLWKESVIRSFDKAYMEEPYYDKSYYSICIGEDKAFVDMVVGQKEKDNANLNIPSGYNVMYQLPNSPFGAKLLEKIAEGDFERTMRERFLSSYQGIDATDMFPHDAKDKNETYILFYGIPDAEKLVRFIFNINYVGSNYKYKIVCFEEQVNLLTEIVKQKELEEVEIVSLGKGTEII